MCKFALDGRGLTENFNFAIFVEMGQIALVRRGAPLRKGRVGAWSTVSLDAAITSL
jgi:hypothetical protein